MNNSDALASRVATPELAPILALPARLPPWHRRHSLWLLALLAAGLLVAVGTAIDLHVRAPRPAPPLLMVAPVTSGRVIGTVRAAGVVEPVQTAVVSQPVAARLVQVVVKPGERVARGQILARFDPLGLQAEFARAEARVVAAEAAAFEAEVKVGRLDRQMGRGSNTDDDVDAENVLRARAASAAAEVNAREAAYRLASRRLAAHVVRAPADGVVLARLVEEGQMVGEGAILFRVSADPTPLQIAASVAEVDSAAVQVGQTVRFSVPALPGRALTGRVTRVAPLAGPETDRRLPVMVSIDPTSEQLRPGMTAGLLIQTASDGPVVRVPTAALLFAPVGTDPRTEQPAVWLTRAGSDRLERLPVAVGLTDGGFAEVRSPRLREGHAVAVGYAAIR